MRHTLQDYDCFSLPSQIFYGEVDTDDFFYEEKTLDPTYNFSYPLPLQTELIHLDKEWNDVGTKVVGQHLKYKNEKNHRRVCVSYPRRGMFQNWRQNLDERVNTGKKANLYPRTLMKYLNILELDPDPYFSGNYNWYLTGGNVGVVTRGKSEYLVRAFGSNVEDLGK